MLLSFFFSFAVQSSAAIPFRHPVSAISTLLVLSFFFHWFFSLSFYFAFCSPGITGYGCAERFVSRTNGPAQYRRKEIDFPPNETETNKQRCEVVRVGGPLPATHDKTQPVLDSSFVFFSFFLFFFVPAREGGCRKRNTLLVSGPRHFRCTFDCEKVIADLTRERRVSEERRDSDGLGIQRGDGVQVLLGDWK